MSPATLAKKPPRNLSTTRCAQPPVDLCGYVDKSSSGTSLASFSCSYVRDMREKRPYQQGFPTLLPVDTLSRFPFGKNPRSRGGSRGPFGEVRVSRSSRLLGFLRVQYRLSLLGRFDERREVRGREVTAPARREVPDCLGRRPRPSRATFPRCRPGQLFSCRLPTADRRLHGSSPTE